MVKNFRLHIHNEAFTDNRELMTTRKRKIVRCMFMPAGKVGSKDKAGILASSTQVVPDPSATAVLAGEIDNL